VSWKKRSSRPRLLHRNSSSSFRFSNALLCLLIQWVRGDNSLRQPIAETTADYNPIAWFYDRHWSSHYHPWALQVLDAILLRRLPQGAAILDLCCGNGVMAREVGRRGFHVTGLDASDEMLCYARMNAPFAEFVLGDARSFDLGKRFHGVLSTFDSLNHILSSEELLATLQGASRSLIEGGVFVFDLNLEDAYTKNWGSSCCTIDDEHACFIRGHYDRDTRLGHTEVSLFGGASRGPGAMFNSCSDSILSKRCSHFCAGRASSKRSA
jgi:SAM-dependent methyltransferase